MKRNYLNLGMLKKKKTIWHFNRTLIAVEIKNMLWYKITLLDNGAN